MLPKVITSIAATLGAALPAHSATQLEAHWMNAFGGSSGHSTNEQISDGSGGVLVCGSTKGAFDGTPGNNNDAFVARFDSEGGLLWVDQFGSQGIDYVTDVSMDAQGRVFITGHYTRGGAYTGGPGFEGYFVGSYELDGQRNWLVGGGRLDRNFGEVVVPDGAGGCIVGGFEWDTSAAGSRDAFVARFDATSGAELWHRPFSAGGEELILSGASDGASGLYALVHNDGGLSGSLDSQAVLLHVDQSGQTLLSVPLDWTTAEVNRTGLYPDGAGGVYAIGDVEGDYVGTSAGELDGTLERWNSDGTLAWAAQTGTPNPDRPFGLTTDPSTGEVLLLNREFGGLQGVSRSSVVRFSAQGVFDRVELLDRVPEFGVTAVITQPSGGLLVAGDRFMGVRGFLARFERRLDSESCAAGAPNSTGSTGTLRALGRRETTLNNVTLRATNIPPDATGYFLASTTAAMVPGAGGSQGTLCLGGAIGRYSAPTEVQVAGQDGRFQITLDLANTPSPTGSVQVLAGQTWFFQAWHRDLNPGPSTNFTNAIAVSFL